jgi:hypothetical protein
MFAELKLQSSYCHGDDVVLCMTTAKPHCHGNVLSRGLYRALKRAGLP